MLDNNKHVLFGLLCRLPNADAHYNCDIEDSLALAIDMNVPYIRVTSDLNHDEIYIN